MISSIIYAIIMRAKMSYFWMPGQMYSEVFFFFKSLILNIKREIKVRFN